MAAVSRPRGSRPWPAEDEQVRIAEDARARNAAAAEALSALLEDGVRHVRGDHRSRRASLARRAAGRARGQPAAPAAQPRGRRGKTCAGGAGASHDGGSGKPAGCGGRRRLGRLLLDALVAALNAGLVPFARELGSLGTGDLSVLAEIGLALLGEGRVWRGRSCWRRSRALADAGLATPSLGPRDGLAFMSSSAASVGHGALVAVDADRLLSRVAGGGGALVLAADADRVVLDPRVHAARPTPARSRSPRGCGSCSAARRPPWRRQSRPCARPLPVPGPRAGGGRDARCPARPRGRAGGRAERRRRELPHRPRPAPAALANAKLPRRFASRSGSTACGPRSRSRPRSWPLG